MEVGNITQDAYLRALKEREKAKDRVTPLDPTNVDLEDLRGAREARTTASGLQKAANQIGNFQGRAQSTEAFDEYAQGMNNSTSADLEARRRLADSQRAQALGAEDRVLSLGESMRRQTREEEDRRVSGEDRTRRLANETEDRARQKRFDDQNLRERNLRMKREGDAEADLDKPLDPQVTAIANEFLAKNGIKASIPASMTRRELSRNPYLSKLIETSAAQIGRSAEKAAAREARTEDDVRKKKEEQDKKQQEVRYRVDSLNQNLDKLNEITERSGTMELFGPESASASSLVYQVAVDYAKLVDPTSVAREGEVAAAQKYMLPIRGALVRNDTAKKLIANLKSDIAKRAEAYTGSFAPRGAETGSNKKVMEMDGWLYEVDENGNGTPIGRAQ